MLPMELRAFALPPGGPASLRGLFAGVEEEQPIVFLLRVLPLYLVGLGCGRVLRVDLANGGARDRSKIEDQFRRKRNKRERE